MGGFELVYHGSEQTANGTRPAASRPKRGRHGAKRNGCPAMASSEGIEVAGGSDNPRAWAGRRRWRVIGSLQVFPTSNGICSQHRYRPSQCV